MPGKNKNMSCGCLTIARSIHSKFVIIYSFRLHMMCNSAGLSGGNNYDDSPTRREQELIQKLEEATDEIEALLIENEKLMMLSNELRFELQQTKSHHQSSSRITNQMSRGNNHDETLEERHEETILDAVLNDQSRSCEESESHESSEVACVGRKPPLSSATDSRPSKTAYVRLLTHFSSCFFAVTHPHILISQCTT